MREKRNEGKGLNVVNNLLEKITMVQGLKMCVLLCACFTFKFQLFPKFVSKTCLKLVENVLIYFTRVKLKTFWENHLRILFLVLKMG